MKILYYQTNHRADGVCKDALHRLGCQIEPFSCPLQEEERFLPLIRQLIQEQRPDAVYSFGYFPALSESCQQEGIFYISYCCDVPTLAMFSKNVTNPCNRILTADSLMVNEFRSRGAEGTFYLPLAPILQLREGEKKENDDILFAGSLHEDNMYRYFAKLPDSARGYLDGITMAQVHVYGYSLFADLMEDDFWNTLMQGISLGKDAENEEKYRYMIEHFFLEQQTTRLERSMILKRLFLQYGEKVRFYTQGKCSVPEVHPREAVPYGRKLAELYRDAGIALNITNRARVSGIPQNVWDILACGAFLISNYQADYEGVLESGRDFVVYESLGELMELVEYYLAHPQERLEIAENGRKKVLSMHTWQERAGAILSLLE